MRLMIVFFKKEEGKTTGLVFISFLYNLCNFTSLKYIHHVYNKSECYFSGRY